MRAMKRLALLALVAGCFGDNTNPLAVDARPVSDGRGDASGDPDAPAGITLRFTEINPAGATDLIELVAVGGGALDGLRVEELTNSSFDYTFPAGYMVAANDVIVLHLAGTCTDQPGDAATCGSPAWDFSMAGNLTYSGKVLELTASGGVRMDAVAFVESGGQPPADYVTAVQLIQSRSAWNPTPCIDDPATGMAKDRYCRNISVIWDALETDNSNSVTRIVGADPLAVPGTHAQWTAALPASFGTYD